MAKLVSTNPAQGYKKIGSVNISTKSEIAGKIKEAQKAKFLWKETPLKKRISYFEKLVKVYKKHSKEVAKLQTMEMGKPITQSIDDVAGDIHYLNAKMKLAPKYLSPLLLDKSKSQKNVLYYEPYGVAAVISPWNYPSGNFFISCTQLLLAGNVIVFKHSEECPLTGKLLEKIMHEAGFPKGVFSEVYGDGKVGDILTDQDVDIIHFTGSTRVGQYLYKKAAKKFIPAILEMGGSSPGIIFRDADLDMACNHSCVERFDNCGQICCALKRLIVHKDIYDVVVERMKANVEQMKIGNPLKNDTEVGPLVAERQVSALEMQVADAKRKGARIVTGGRRAGNLKGAFYKPTVITNVKPNMKILTEETFGPVLPIQKFSTEEEAIHLANNTIYGLSAYVYGKNVTKLREVSMKLDTGVVSVNGTSYFSDNSPFGGYKMSGMGRNDGLAGFYESTQKKVVSEPV